MVDIVKVDRDGPMPSEDADFIQIVRRFDTENTQRTLIDIDVFIAETGDRESLAGDLDEIEQASIDTIVEQATEIAEQRDIETIYVADLTLSA